MTAVWLTIAVLFVLTVSFKAVGPVAVGGRGLSPRVSNVVSLVAPALLAALVVYETLIAEGHGIDPDARLIGIALAAVAIALRGPLLAVVAVSAIATALARALL